MKRNTIIIIAAMLLASCLRQEPISLIGDTSFYKNTDQLNAAVVACYNGLHKPMEYEWMLTELRSDNARLYNTATTSTVNTLLFDFDQSRISATNQHVYSYWQAVYHNIARCNAVLSHIDVVDDAHRGQYEGEARFIRAYHYFNLVRLFGPVFIVRDRLTADGAREMVRATIDEVYRLIEEDLTYAARNLPTSYDDANLGRATCWAAKGLLAKVRLTRGQYDTTTHDLLKDIIDHSGHDLMPTYASVFDIANEMNAEIIFTIRYTSGGLGLGNPFGNRFAPQQSGANVINGDGNGYNYPTDNLVGAYSSADTRRDVTLALDYKNEKDEIIDRRYVKKYLSPVVVKEDGDRDWPVLRYADILLLYAEVLNELEGPAAAVPYLNKTRERAGLSALSASDFGNKHAMRTALDKERRLELAYENQRWFDLIRTERVVDVMETHWQTENYYSSIIAATGMLTLSDNTLLLPIPQKEIDINQDITQNVGY